MSETVDIQYFASDGTWAKPPGAVRVDTLIRGGGAGGALGKDGGDGELTAKSVPASELPDEVAVEVGRGGRGSDGGGRGADGYALILTHLATERPA